jgi:hypothetical protein
MHKQDTRTKPPQTINNQQQLQNKPKQNYATRNHHKHKTACSTRCATANLHPRSSGSSVVFFSKAWHTAAAPAARAWPILLSDHAEESVEKEPKTKQLKHYHRNSRKQSKTTRITRCTAAHSHSRFSDCSVVFFSKTWHTAAAPASPILLSDDAEELEDRLNQDKRTTPPQSHNILQPLQKQPKAKQCNPQSSQTEMTTHKNVHHTMRYCKLTSEVK